MIVCAFEPDRAIRHDGVELSGGGEAAEAPFLLVPPTAKNPWSAWVLLGKLRNLFERFIEAVRVRQVERQRGKADIHHVDVCIDHAGQHHLPICVHCEFDALGAFLAAFKRVSDDPVIIIDQLREALHLAVFVDGDAVDIVDKRVSGCGRGDERGTCCEKSADHGRSHLVWDDLGSRVISALVSSLFPPCACTSA